MIPSFRMPSPQVSEKLRWDFLRDTFFMRFVKKSNVYLMYVLYISLRRARFRHRKLFSLIVYSLPHVRFGQKTLQNMVECHRRGYAVQWWLIL